MWLVLQGFPKPNETSQCSATPAPPPAPICYRGSGRVRYARAVALHPQPQAALKCHALCLPHPVGRGERLCTHRPRASDVPSQHR